MTITTIQSPNPVQTAVPSVTANFANTPAQGNSLRAWVLTSGTVLGGTSIPGWTLVDETPCGYTTTNGTVPGAILSLFIKTAGAAETKVVTATGTGSNLTRIQISEATGVNVGIAPTTTKSNSGFSNNNVTSLPAGSAGQAASVGDELFAAWASKASSATGQAVDSGFSLAPVFVSRLTPAGLVTSAAGTINPTLSWTNAQSMGGMLALFKPSATGSPNIVTAPAVTGTLAVGSVLTSDGGTWDQTLSGRTYQWQTNASGSFANISGATGSTYTVGAGDAGRSLRCVVTATSGNGNGTANSNAVAIPAAPVNTAAPVIAVQGGGTAGTGKVLFVQTPGVYTGTGISLTYQWYRGSTPITGQTDPAGYLLAQSDEGAIISVKEVAANGGGTSPAASSNTITPAVTAPLSDASFLNYLSGGAGNTSGAASIGGVRGGTYDGQLNALIGPILGSVAAAGGVFYRVLYPRNTHTSATAANLMLFVETQFPAGSGLQLAVAVPAEAANTAVAPLASGTTEPAGVTWITATDPSAGAAFGSLAAGAYRGVHVRLTVSPGAPLSGELDAGFALDGTAA